MKDPYEAVTGSGGLPTDWHVELDMYNVIRQSNQGMCVECWDKRNDLICIYSKKLVSNSLY